MEKMRGAQFRTIDCYVPYELVRKAEERKILHLRLMKIFAVDFRGNFRARSITD